METGLDNSAALRASRPTIVEGGVVNRVILAGQSIEYGVRLSNRAKNLRLQVTPDMGLTVVAPTNFNLLEIEKILQLKKDWILNQFHYFNQLAEARPHSASPAPEPQASIDAGKITLLNSPLLYLGRECHVLLNIEPELKGLIKVNLKKATLRVAVADEGQAVAAVEKWYYQRANYYINKRTEMLSKVIGVTYNSITVRQLKTRWGSCSGHKNLNFNWRLIMAPPSVIDYVIIHELCHLIELNHSKRFWAIVASRCPTYDKERNWLRSNISKLNVAFI